LRGVEHEEARCRGERRQRYEPFALRRIVDPNVFSMVALATSSRRPTTATQGTALRLMEEMCRQRLVPANERVRQFVQTLGVGPSDARAFDVMAVPTH
jgi:hypothetical protein